MGPLVWSYIVGYSLSVLLIYLKTKKTGNKEKLLTVLFCRLWPDVVRSDDTPMTTAVNRARAVSDRCCFGTNRFIQCGAAEEESGLSLDYSPAEERDADWNMSGDKATSPCNKFQANIFNKSKCQNCFKSRELHLLTDHDMEQVTKLHLCSVHVTVSSLI